MPARLLGSKVPTTCSGTASAVGPPVSFQARGLTPQRSVRTLCTAPCKSELPAGSYQFSLSLAGGDPLIVKEPLTIEPSVTLALAALPAAEVELMSRPSVTAPSLSSTLPKP